MPAGPNKVCVSCGVARSLDDFPRRASSPDGRRGQCKPCRQSVQHAWERRDPERTRRTFRESMARHRARHPGRVAAQTAATKARHPNHWRARNAVGHAVERGCMQPASSLSCVDCGGPAAQYDHYLGYEPAHWLDVQPVCARCHGRRSAARGEHPRRKVG